MKEASGMQKSHLEALMRLQIPELALLEHSPMKTFQPLENQGPIDKCEDVDTGSRLTARPKVKGIYQAGECASSEFINPAFFCFVHK